MAHLTPQRIARQIRSAQQQLHQSATLPLAAWLDAAHVEEALREQPVRFRRRIYSPLVTLYVFLAQVLDPLQCCRKAVARLLAYRAAQGLPPCSAQTGAYCQARRRLPEAVLHRLARQTGRRLRDQAEEAWRWHGRDVKVVDGTTLSMPDTPANQAAYPQPPSQRPGVGFPLLRLVVVFTLAVGTALDAALGRYQGKQTGETSLWRTLLDQLDADDVVLADRLFGTYFDIALIRQCGADAVFRLHNGRRADFRRGRRLGRGDRLARWTKPRQPDWLDAPTYARLPEALEVRLVRVRVTTKGFRTKVIVVVTTLRDAALYRAADLAELYRARWYAELDLRSLKGTLHMDVLRCQTPEMVRKEVWAHLLAYNLIRGLMADAARRRGVRPRELSFAGALQALEAFADVLHLGLRVGFETLYERLVAAIASHRVGDRPDRYEPRARKRRPKSFPWLKTPRWEAKARLENKPSG